MAKPKLKKVTIDDLAAMVQRGFEGISGEMATKKELMLTKTELRQEISALRTEMNDGFNHLTTILMAVHENRLDRLEGRVGRLETKLARQ